jgi:hypothetical protein
MTDELIRPYEHGPLPLPPCKPIAHFDTERRALFVRTHCEPFWLFDLFELLPNLPLPAIGGLDFY